MIAGRARRTAVITGFVTVALVMAGCGAPDSGSSDGKLKVVASSSVWGSVAEAVGGDRVEVESIVTDPSADPHSYESTPRDAAKIHDADLVIYNGGGYDEFIEQILTNEQGKPVVRAVQEEGHEHEHGHGHANEHVWYDPHVVQETADRLATQLHKLRGDQDFHSAAQRFGGEVARLDERVHGIAERHSGTPVIVTEPVAHYLVEHAGLKDVTPRSFVRAVEAENDPPAAAVAEIQDAMRSHRAATVIYNPQTESPVTERVRGTAQDSGIPVAELTEIPPKGTSYVRWMGDQINRLDNALNGA